MAGVVGFEPTVHGIKTRGYCYQELSGKSRKLLSKVLSKIGDQHPFLQKSPIKFTLVNNMLNCDDGSL